MKRFYFSKLIILVTLLLGSKMSANAQTTVFNYTGAVQTYTVAAGVTQLGIDMKGGCGGYAYISSGTNPVTLGGRVQCTLAVSGGQVLNIYVGGAGANWSGSYTNGAYNGGGGGGTFAAAGGGASDIRIGGVALTNRVVVAGAGGGGGDFSYLGGKGGDLTGGTGQSGACGGGQTGPGCSTGYALGTFGQGAPAGLGNQYSIGGGGGGWYGGNQGVYLDGGGGGGSSYTSPTLCSAVIHTQGYSGANGAGQVTVTVLCTAPGAIVGTLSACVGTTTTLTNPTGAPGTWVSSNPAVASIGSGTGIVTGVSAGTAIITQLQANPCGGVSATATVTINPVPGAISGASMLCTGLSTTLTDTAAGGAWTTSDGTVATVTTGGLVSGLTPGPVTITYTLPAGCSRSTSLVVNGTPFIFNLTGGGPYCTGGTGVHIGLSSSTSGVSYQLYRGTTSVATLTGTGSALDFGLFTVAGTYTAVATDPATGCSANMTGSTTVVINPLPGAITGTSNVCTGLTTTLSDPTPGGTWASSSTSVATVNPGTGEVTGVVAGIATITYTLASTGCKTTIPFVVNSQPAAIGGPTSVCAGANITLTDASSGGTWSSSSTGVASVVPSTGYVTGLTPGTTTITYSLSTGCNVSSTLLVNPVPVAYGLTGGGSYCAGSSGVHIGMVFSSSGVNYQLYLGTTPVGFPVAGSNSGLDFGSMTAPGTYTVKANNPLTGCDNNMTGSVSVVVNPLPNIYNVTGGGGVCVGGAGVNIGLDHSDVGMKYQLYNGTTAVGPLVSGSGFAINMGNYSAGGVYTVVASNPLTGCTNTMNNSATITVNPLPTVYTMNGGGHYCSGGAGVHIGLGGSDAGTTYKLYRGTSLVSSVPSTGGALDFGLFTMPGVYSVVGTDGLGCTNNMAGTVNVTIDPLPVVYNVTGTGGYCTGGAGLHVGLDFSSIGISYQLWYSGGVVTTVAGSGSGLDFGAQVNPGVYTVVAVNTANGCSNNMAGAAVISVNPLPNSYNVTGGGNYCIGGTGVHVGTDLSDFGINYQLYRGTVPVGPAAAGTGGPLDFGVFTTPGVYTVVAINPVTGCIMTQTGSATIGTNPLPALHTVTGGGAYCASGAGINVAVNGSETGINYELYLNSVSTGTVLGGTGGVLDFGLQTAPGIYTVVATNPGTGCSKNMTGSATIVINSLPALHIITGGGSYCAGGAGMLLGLDGSNAGISYQLYNGSGAVGSPIAGTGGALNFGLKTAAGTYYVVATNPLTLCSATMAGTTDIFVDPLPNDFAITGGGAYCAGGAGVDLTLTGSDIGISYQLYRGGTPVGGPLNGVNDVLDFGYQTIAGVYTVRATDLVTSCVKNMPGSAIVTVISNTVYTMTGGGGYCAGGTGVHVGLSGSATGVDYQLWNSLGPVGTAMSGSGSTIDFGLQTDADVYTVVATNTTYGCTDPMTGSSTVTINALPDAHTMTGGGSYCAGGTGVHVGLDNGDAGINYQLYNGLTATGSPVAGDGSALDFGMITAAGTYTAIATNATTGCSSNMTASADVIIKALPNAFRDSITGENPVYPGYYCAADSGVHIYLQGSESGVDYQLWRGTTMIGSTVTGTGGIIDLGLQNVAGSYTVTALDGTSGCANTMLGTLGVHIIPLPIVHNVTGGGGYCPGAAGVHVGLDGSEAGYYYQLYINGTTHSNLLYGSGGPLDFGVKDSVGVYTVIANNQITTCLNNMFDAATVYVDTLRTPNVTIHAYPGTGIHVWHIDSMRVDVTNGGDHPTYQWIINGHVLAGATNASFSRYELFNNDSVACQVTASGPCGGLTTTKWLIITLHTEGVSNVGNNADIRLIPNPNKGTFTVKGTSGTSVDEDVTLEVTNMLGQVVYTKKTTIHGGNIDEAIQLSNVSNGMYLLNLRSSNGNTVFHFVVEQ